MVTVQAILVPSSSTVNKLDSCNALKPCFFVPLQKKQMKRRNSHLILLIPILFTACHNSSLIETLDYIDSLCNVRPDSAVIMLDSIGEYVLNENENVIHWWQLLSIKSQDRTDRPLVSDSIIKKVTTYYDQHGPIEKRIESHYYLGRTYAELHDRPRALVEFLNVISLSEKYGIPNPHAMANACSQLSEIYRRQEQYSTALDIVKKGYQVAEDYGFMDPIYIMDVATCYKGVGDLQSTRKFYQKALTMMREEDCLEEYSEMITEILDHYARWGHKKQADECLQILESFSPEKRPKNYFGGKASYFEYFGPLDSAIHYNRIELMDSTDYLKCCYSARTLMALYLKKGNYQEACRYAMAYVEANDSMKSQLKIAQTQDANNEYQYYRDLGAETEVYKQASKARLHLTLTIALAIIVLLIVLTAYLSYQRQMEHKLYLHNQVIQNQKEEMRLKDATISEQQHEVGNLIRHTLSSVVLNSPSEVFDRFQNAAKGRGRIKDDIEWEELAATLDLQYPHFITSVYERWPLIKPDELHVVCLMKMGLNNTQIMNVTEQPKTSVYRRIRKIRQNLDDLIKTQT